MDLLLIIKELTEEFEVHHISLWEITKKYITVSVSAEKKVTKIDKKNLEKNLIDYNFLIPQDLISNLINNLAEKNHKINCKHGHDGEKCKTYWFKYKVCVWCLQCACQRLANRCIFSNRDIDKFVLLLRKGVINTWITRKMLMKCHYQKEKAFIVT